MYEQDFKQAARIKTPNIPMEDVFQLGDGDQELKKSVLDKVLADLQKIRTRLCPRQVLGVRMGIYAGRILNLQMPQTDKGLIVFMETDGCALDGVTASTGCRAGRRTLRVMDYGKVAATFVDTYNRAAIRIAPQIGVREAAWKYAPDASNRWEAQLSGYQAMPSHELFTVQPVSLMLDLEKIISQPGLCVICAGCGEEIMNGREIHRDGENLCRTCSGKGYYFLEQNFAPLPIESLWE
jgi:formylmethanofuran dehydrogenase subunit E